MQVAGIEVAEKEYNGRIPIENRGFRIPVFCEILMHNFPEK